MVAIQITYWPFYPTKHARSVVGLQVISARLNRLCRWEFGRARPPDNIRNGNHRPGIIGKQLRSLELVSCFGNFHRTEDLRPEYLFRNLRRIRQLREDTVRLAVEVSSLS